ncbi:MAG: hypothetical protein ABI643_02095 [Candidatus Doudnabacteria bacterium]
MTKKLRIIIWVFVAAVWALFFIKAGIAVDTDFGWHVKTGEIILNAGIPRLDPFSYTMPSYLFVDHEWLTDIMIAKIFPIIGFWGLGLIFTGLAVLSILLLLDISSIKILGLPILIASPVLLYSGGTRPQVITWFFLSLLFWVIFKSKKREKLKYGLPLIFLLWANLHGGFIIGLAVLGIVIIGQTIENRALSISDLLVFLSSILITIFNPYGLGLWKEIFISLRDPYLRQVINEWTTPFLRFDPAFVSLLALAGFLVFKFWKKLNLAELILFIFFTLSAISSTRNVPLWILTVLLLLPKLIVASSQTVPNTEATTKVFHKLYAGAAAFTFVVVFVSLSWSVPEIFGFTLKNYYPARAVEYINTHSLHQQIFAPYTWGGYLIWRLTTSKVFIDGRMPSWRLANPSSNESGWAMKEYEDLLAGKIEFEKITEKYGINTVLWPARLPKQILAKLDPKTWTRVYQDQISVIYTRNMVK